MAFLIVVFILLIPYLCLGFVFKILQYHYTDGETWRKSLGIAFGKFIAPALGFAIPVVLILISLGILYFLYTVFENAFF